MKSFTAWGVGLILLGSVVGCQGQPAATRDDRAGAQATSAIQRLPRLVDVGAGKCIPCKAMAPILEDLRTRYAGKLEVLFVDVCRQGRTEATGDEFDEWRVGQDEPVTQRLVACSPIVLP